MNRPVRALAVVGTNLYAAGGFTEAGGVPADHVAKWDGSSWSALGSGFDGSVAALATDAHGHLFGGGSFSRAGTHLSPFIAQANIGLLSGRFDDPTATSAAGFQFTFRDALIGEHYRIQTSQSLPAGTWSDFTNFTYIGPLIITDASAGERGNRSYRAVGP